MQNLERIYIGIDGGGSTCRGALVAGLGGARIEVVAGPANVSEFEPAIATILNVLLALVAKADLEASAIARAYVHLGLAGVTGPQMVARVKAALRGNFPAARMEVSEDRATMLVGALGDLDGSVAAIGTGSFVARQVEGSMRAAGGHGLRLGDQGSGAWLGLRALQEVMLIADGLASDTGLSRQIMGRFGNERAAIVEFSLRATSTEIAAIAPDIVAAAAAGDPLAMALMRDGSDYIQRALLALGAPPGEALCLTGGIGPHYRGWLPMRLAEAVVPPMGSALDGAVALAMRGAP